MFFCKGYEGVAIVAPSIRAFYMLLCEYWPSCVLMTECTCTCVRCILFYYLHLHDSHINTTHTFSLSHTHTFTHMHTHTQSLISYSLIRARCVTLYTCTCKLVTQPAPLAPLEKVCNVPLVWLLTTCHTWWVETVKWGRAKLWEVFFMS